METQQSFCAYCWATYVTVNNVTNIKNLPWKHKNTVFLRYVRRWWQYATILGLNVKCPTFFILNKFRIFATNFCETPSIRFHNGLSIGSRPDTCGQMVGHGKDSVFRDNAITPKMHMKPEFMKWNTFLYSSAIIHTIWLCGWVWRRVARFVSTNK
jgi:hypothetical protein